MESHAGKPGGSDLERRPAGASAELESAATDPILCGHCGRTASNGISCIGACVADSGY